MSVTTYRVTNETRGHLGQFIDDLIDIAAQGNAPSPMSVVGMIETILEDGYYEPAARDEEDRVIDKEVE